MTSEARQILKVVGGLAGLVALALLVGIFAPPAPPAELFQYFEPAYVERARDFAQARYRLFLLGWSLPVILLALLVAQGWDRRLSAWLEGRVGPRPLLVAMLLGGILSLATTLAGLPAAAGRFILDHRHGLSTQGWASWFGDLALATAIDLTFTLPLLAGLFWLIRHWPRGWWAPVTLGFGLFLSLSYFIQPVAIDPLFNTFTPLQDPALAQDVRELAGRAGLPVDEVLVMDASRRTRRVNAYFTGFGGTRRIVLYDTLVQGYDRPQVLAVLAHELGHWRHNHIYWGILQGTLGAGAGFWLAARLLRGMRGRPGEPAQLAVLMLFFLLLQFAALPVQNLISRTMERQADRFAVALTGDVTAMVGLEVQLARDNLANVAPHPLVVAVLYTHPPVLERIQIALEAAP